MSSLNSTRVKAPARLVPFSNLVSQGTNDPIAPNSQERTIGDRHEIVTPPKLLKCKKQTIFSTFNVCSLTQISRKQELLQNFSKYNLDILSLQEHRNFHPDSEFQHLDLGKNKLITSSDWKNHQGTTIGGIGIFLSPKASNNLLSVNKVSDRIIVAEFNSNPKTSFISCYSPTNVSDESLADDFYSSLSATLQNIPAHNFVVVAGDFNAQMGSDHRVVSVNVFLSLRSSKRATPDPMKSIDWTQVLWDSELQSAYVIEVKNRFDVLSKPNDDVETKYSNLIKANEHVCLSYLPKKQKCKSKVLHEDNLVKNARKTFESAKLKHQTRATRRSGKALADAQKGLDDAYLTAESLFIQGKIDSIKAFHESKKHSASWKVINEISGHKDYPSIQLKGGSAEKRRTNWLKHFKDLLGNVPTGNANALPLHQVLENLNIPTNTFTLDELKKTVKLFSSNKSSGLDNLPTILWKDPTFLTLLLEFCNHTFEYHSPPSAWLTGGIIPVPKKGDLTLA
ncbi:uncharacterized protein [Clytia hemisphaerica]|uniref:uncharacterized protein n=1 Tax=Clytia hemisphaerica TaxID=252671 RepID=UPI0034D7110A